MIIIRTELCCRVCFAFDHIALAIPGMESIEDLKNAMKESLRTKADQLSFGVSLIGRTVLAHCETCGVYDRVTGQPDYKCKNIIIVLMCALSVFLFVKYPGTIEFFIWYNN